MINEVSQIEKMQALYALTNWSGLHQYCVTKSLNHGSLLILQLLKCMSRQGIFRCKQAISIYLLDAMYLPTQQK